MLDVEQPRMLGNHLDALDAAETLEDVQVVMRTAPRRLVRAMGSTFVLREGDQCFYVDEDAASPLWKGQRFPIDECISGWAMLHGETAVVPDVRVDERIPQEAYRPTFVRSLVMVPVGRPPVAAMGVYWGRVHRADARELEVLEHLAAVAGEAVERIGLHGAPVAPVLRLL